MTDKTSYPQIPSTVWWGVRALLMRSPNVVMSEQVLSAQLNVQPTAARQYIAELKRVGILNDDNKATNIAEKWRHDDTYQSAVDEILNHAYPEDLVALAPRGNAERQKVIRWFAGAGLGAGTAANKAATYLLICSETPGESNSRGGATNARPASPSSIPTEKPTRRKLTEKPLAPSPRAETGSAQFTQNIPLNINVQIHISADASSDQIESIFSAMRRYLYDKSSDQ